MRETHDFAGEEKAAVVVNRGGSFCPLIAGYCIEREGEGGTSSSRPMISAQRQIICN